MANLDITLIPIPEWNGMETRQGCTHNMLLQVHSVAYCRRTPKPSPHWQPVKEDNEPGDNPL